MWDRPKSSSGFGRAEPKAAQPALSAALLLVNGLELLIDDLPRKTIDRDV